MRIKFIVPLPLDEEGVSNRRRQIPENAIASGTEVVFAPVKNGSLADSASADLVADFFIYEEGLRAEREGFDAVCIDTVSDSGLAPLRSRLSIPVVGPGQASFHLAAMLGNRFSIVTMWDRWVHLYERSLKTYGLAKFCASIRHPQLVPDVRNLLGGKEDEVFPKLEECCRRCVLEDGADVIVLGSTTMHEAHSYLAHRLPVPIINPGLVAFRMAETLVTLGLAHSKKAFPTPQEPKDDVFETAANAVNARPPSAG